MHNILADDLFYKILCKRNSQFISVVDEIATYANNLLPKINSIFFEYTGHGIEHSLSVSKYMYYITAKPDLLSDLEIATSIIVALLHDVGMILNEHDILDIKANKFKYISWKYEIVLSRFNGNERIAIQECVRPIHGLLSRMHINKNLTSELKIPGKSTISFIQEVGAICESHTHDFDWIILNISDDIEKGEFELNARYISMLLRLADLLDIDETRAPRFVYDVIQPEGISSDEWKKHYVVENSEKIQINKKSGLREIVFYGESSNPQIHRKILKYIDSINDELKRIVSSSEKFEEEKYLINLKTEVIDKIKTLNFSFSNLKLSLNYNAVTSLLMGENIYGNRKYGLREIIQNSIDACKLMVEESTKLELYKYDSYKPYIIIDIDEARNKVHIIDNGTGMSIDILRKYFLNIGVSYYSSNDYLFKSFDYKPIGNYGIGFLSCFMISESAEVITKTVADNEIVKIDLTRGSEYICLSKITDSRSHGTEISLDYNEFLNTFDRKKSSIISFIKDNFIDCKVPIKVRDSNIYGSTEEMVELSSPLSQCIEGICLSNYVNDLEVYVEMTYKGIYPIDLLSDLGGEHNYYYSSESQEVISEEDLVDNKILKDYIVNNEISFIEMPVIHSSEKNNFEKAFDVLEDYDQALEKISYEVARILSDDECYPHDTLFEESNSEILPNFTFNEFCYLTGHDESIPSQTARTSIEVVSNDGDSLLTVLKNANIGEHFFSHGEKIYLKGVLLSQSRLLIPFILKGIRVKKLVVNINSKSVIPNVSRTNISNEVSNQLSYAIGRAIHMWIYDHGIKDSIQKDLIRDFVTRYYNEKNVFIR